MADAKIVLITGANTGIGFQIVRALYSADKPYSVIVGARSLSKAQDAINTIQTEFPSSQNQLSPLVIDIEYDDSIQTAYNEVHAKFGKLDALINNAGAQFEQLHHSGTLTEREAWNQSWNINTTGTQIMTSTFIPLLLNSSSPGPYLIFITSGASTLTGTETRHIPIDRSPAAGWPKTGPGVPAYRSAKTGLNMLMREWERILKNDGVKVFGVSPGLLATGLGGNREFLKKIGAGDPVVAGPFLRDVLEGGRDGDVGRVVTRDGVQDW
ncbi:hypothetical protein BDW59DRAFT_139416 [Aspergillus cavernicola]|uniref:NAD(P)-binding protein n=1 Tax=Aspergillus cavernicola TaxID=176166 RepID=A0ABR4IXS3_9EURO